MNIYYLGKNGFIKLEKVIKPINESLFNDDRSNVSEISCVSSTPSGFIKNQLFKFETARENRYYIAGDIKETIVYQPTSSGLVDNYLTTIKLNDCVEILEQFVVQSCCFSAGSYTLEQLISRLLRLAKADILYTLPNVDTFNPYFEWKSASLKNCLLEVANSLDKVLQLTFNEELHKFSLYFSSKGGGGIVRPLNYLNGKNRLNEALSGNLAKMVYSEVVNVEAGAKREPAHSYGLTTETMDGSATVTNENAGVTLNNKIKDIALIRVFGYYDTGEKKNAFDPAYAFDIAPGQEANLIELYYIPSEGTNYPYTEKTYNHTIKCMTKADFDLIENEDNKKGIIYYDENKVYLDHFLPKKHFTLPRYDENFFCKAYSIDRPNPNEHETFTLLSGRYDKLEKVRVEVTYYPVLTSATPIKILNGSNLEGVTYYNQGSNNLDVDKFGRVLSSYIESMQAEDLLRSKTYPSSEYNDIMLPGDMLISGSKRYVITSVSFTYNVNNVEAVYQLNENHIAKYENATPDTKIRISTPPLDEHIQRTIHELESVDVSLGEPMETHSLPAHITNKGLSVFFDLWTSASFPVFAAIVQFYGADINEKLNRYAATADTFIIDNAFISQFKCKNNVLFSLSNKGGNIIPWQYVNQEGQNNFIDIEFLAGDYISEDNPYFNQFLQDYPYLDENWDFQNKVLAYYRNYKTDKDYKEQLSFTYELFYTGVNNTMLSTDFLKELILEEHDLQLYCFNHYIYKHDALSRNDPPLYIYNCDRIAYDKTTNSQQLLADGVDTTDLSQVKCLVLAHGLKPLIIKNLAQPINKIKGIKIYYNAHNYTGARTGVVRKDN